MKNRILLGLSFILLTLCTSVWANEADQKAARQVIEDWFVAMKDGNTEQAANYLSPKFVSIHTDGIVRDKEQELILIKHLNMKSYHLTDFKYSETTDTIVITYKDNGSEKIDNTSIAKGATGRMAVLQKKDNKWIIIAYANLDRIG